jgi:uncharacterized repeat protein (TIGR01451 family)
MLRVVRRLPGSSATPPRTTTGTGARAAVLAACVGALAAPACGSDARPPEATGIANAAIVDGAGNVTISTAGTVVNRYTALAADAVLGATTLTVASGAALAPIAAGDLLMVIQMQGATIDTTNTATYGAVTALAGAGLYEMVTVGSVAANTITLDTGCGLKNAYKAAAHTQVIWVPQYRTLTVSGAGSIVPTAWNGSTGGVVAIQASTASLQAAGAINVAGMGFRGGAVKQQTTNPVAAAPPYVSAVNTAAAEKGEGIAGYHTEYDASGGRYGIGSPANGGGGGGPHNSGGGGGANGNNGNAYSGAGVMPAGITGAAAWALDPEDIAAGGLTTSAGGGRGGYTYSAAARDPTVVAPGNALWGGDHRQQHGGRGGRPLANSALSQIFMGGGGGAGESNNGAGTNGAAGGGIVLLIGKAIDGASTGSIVADGATGQTTLTGGGLNGNDAPGGGGGGGTIVLLAPAVTNLSLSANGGGGGLQNITIPPEAEGPGGGGGGGFIAAPAGFAVAAPAGGAGGTTNSNGVTKFPRNGTTDGATGQTAVIAAGAQGPVCIAANLQLTMSDGVANVTPGTNVTYTIVATNGGPNPVTGAGLTDTFSPQFTAETWTCAGAACPAPSGSGNIAATLLALPPGASVTFTVTATVASSATGTLSNTASITPPPGVTDSSPANDSATVTNSLTASADLGATLAFAPTPVVIGTAYTYTIGVTDSGPSDGASAQAVLTLPAGVTYQGFSGAGWSCVFASPTVTCTRAALAAGASAPIAINVTAPGVAGSGSATVVVSSGATDPSGANNTATAPITFVQCAPSNSTACTGTTPLCSAAGQCVPCSGDQGTGATNACVAAAPYCAATGACTSCSTDAQCTTGAHPGPYCNTTTGACTTTCQSDAECGAGNWCNNLSGPGMCEAKVANGQGVAGQTCTATLGTRACISTVCDTRDNLCGYGNGDGPCQSSTGPTECRSTICATLGPNAGKCEACNTNGDCSGANPVCDPTTSTCGKCNGDSGSGATDACGAASPYCTASGSCSACATDGDCTTGTHAGPYCNTTTGACTTACQRDAECGAGNWCNNLSAAGVCQPKVPNGQGVTGQACTSTLGTRACVSAVCDTSDNLCGYRNGDGPCGSASGATVCRSGICSASLVCMPAGTCDVDADCITPALPHCDQGTHTCVATPSDGGAIDAGISDSGAADGGVADAGLDGSPAGDDGGSNTDAPAVDAAADATEDAGPGSEAGAATGPDAGGSGASGYVEGGGCNCNAAGQGAPGDSLVWTGAVGLVLVRGRRRSRSRNASR